MINNFFHHGIIKKIQVSTPKDPKKNASAVILVQHGTAREMTGNAVEFVNAVQIRIPSYKYPKVADKLKVGLPVTIHGHHQGILKTAGTESFFTVELVADRLFFGNLGEGSENGDASGEAAPAAAE